METMEMFKTKIEKKAHAHGENFLWKFFLKK